MAVSFGIADLYFHVLVTDHTFVAFHSEEPHEQDLDLPYWRSVVYEDMDNHASLADSEVEPAAVFCSCFVVPAQAVEIGLVGVEALPMIEGLERTIITKSRDLLLLVSGMRVAELDWLTNQSEESMFDPCMTFF